MDEATKKLVMGIASGFLRKAAIGISGALTTHGIAVSGSFTETFVAAGIGLGVWAYSSYGDYVRVIVHSQLEVLKAKSLAQAAKLQAHNIAPPDAAAVAAASAKSPDMATLSVEQVKAASATLPAAVAGAVAALALFFLALTLATPALAQRADDLPRAAPSPRSAPGFKPVPLTGNLGNDLAAAKAQKESEEASTNPFPCDVSLFTKLTFGNVVNQIKNCVGDVGAGLAKPFADDLRDSAASAKANNDMTAVNCYTPALALAEAAQGTPAAKDSDGKETTPARPPGPILIFQKFREFVNAGGITSCKAVVLSTTAATLAGAAP